ncbi:MAG: hypothetical protein LBN40_00490 [Oscillospiraceae bacterium]|jgi:hypothetical protein|nr:hypothetical protein [Oscillospiraceae bacterium]
MANINLELDRTLSKLDNVREKLEDSYEVNGWWLLAAIVGAVTIGVALALLAIKVKDQILEKRADYLFDHECDCDFCSLDDEEDDDFEF